MTADPDKLGVLSSRSYMHLVMVNPDEAIKDIEKSEKFPAATTPTSRSRARVSSYPAADRPLAPPAGLDGSSTFWSNALVI